ncbi:MAG: YidC/Oxa1 family membrane protein insertase [Vulcanimicrobiaceae bacterium]
MHLILAANWFLDPIVNVITQIVDWIDVVVRNRGWSLVIFALLFKIAFWPLNTKQFMAMMNMQKIAPKLKALQAKYGKSDPQKYQQETMALYKEHGVNPLAGCWPMLVQYPIIISVFYAVTSNEKLYAKAHWLWIGAPFTHHLLLLWGTTILATSLAGTDLVLLALYMLSMYFYSRYATMPSTDPQQAQTQKMMAIMSPLMLGFFGFKYHWPSAMVLYWFSYNAFTMGQQFYLLRKYHQPLSVLDSEHAVTDIPEVVAIPAAKPSTNGQSGAPTAKKKKKGTKK